MSGNFSTAAGTVTFSLSRTGTAQFTTSFTSDPISRLLEGTWTGGFAVEKDDFRVRMTLTNEPGGH